MLWAAGAPPLIGRESLRGMLERTFAVADIMPGFELEERIVSGDLAVDRGWDRQELRPKDGSPPRSGSQRVILVLRARWRGTWRFARGFSQPGPRRVSHHPAAAELPARG